MEGRQSVDGFIFEELYEIMRMLLRLSLSLFKKKKMEALEAKEIALSDEMPGAGDDRGASGWHRSLLFTQITSLPSSSLSTGASPQAQG